MDKQSVCGAWREIWPRAGESIKDILRLFQVLGRHMQFCLSLLQAQVCRVRVSFCDLVSLKEQSVSVKKK